MKKIKIIVNILLLVGLVFCATGFSITFARRIAGVNLFRWMTVGISAVLAITNGVFMVKTKSHQIIFDIAINLAVVFMALSFAIGGFSAVWPLTCLVVAAVLLCVSLGCVSGFKWPDLAYSLCVTVVTIALVFCSNIFGFRNIWIKLLIGVEICVFACLVGKSIANLIQKRTVKRSLQFAGAILFFIANFTYLLISFSNISHYIQVVFNGLIFVAAILIALSQLFNESSQDVLKLRETTKESFKKNKWGIVATSLLVVFIGYSTALTFSAFSIATGKVYKEQFLASMGENFALPIIEINTQNSEFPTSKENYVNASFKISNCENEDYNFAVEMADSYGDDGSVGIRLRGNSTQNARKKPFRIKFDEKQSLLGLTKAKSWVLLADYFDQSYIRNYTAFSIAQNFDNLDFTPSPHHVALILNGSFQGLYLLCEQVDENKGRTNVEEDFDVTKDTEFPFLVEMDELAYKEGKTGVDNFYVEDFYPVEIKYPEADERGATEAEDKVYDYICEYINAVFTTLKTGATTKVSFRDDPVSFEDLVDIDSAVDYYLLAEIMHNPDATYKSIYFHKSKDGKMKFGPIWDYDYSMGAVFDLPYKESYIWSANNIYMARYSKIFSKLIENEGFYNKVQARYLSLSHTLLDVAENLKLYKMTISNIARLDASLWHGNTGVFQFDMQYDYVRLYLQDRYAFLNSAFTRTHTEFVVLLG